MTPVTKQLERVLSDFERGSTMISGYEEFKAAKESFGLIGAEGPQNSPGSRFRKTVELEGQFVLQIIAQARPGQCISIMNTYFERPRDFSDCIKQAMKSGVHFRILLITTDPEAHVITARIKDFDEIESRHDSEVEFTDDVRQSHKALEKLRHSPAIQEGAQAFGSIDIRYYSKSLNLPLIFISNDFDPEIKPFVAYTGFYSGFSSELLPYVKWSGGNFDMVSVLYSLFEKKWRECAHNTEMHDPSS